MTIGDLKVGHHMSDRDPASLLACAGAARRVSINCGTSHVNFLLAAASADLGKRLTLTPVDQTAPSVIRTASVRGSLFGRGLKDAKGKERKKWFAQKDGDKPLLGDVLVLEFGQDKVEQFDSLHELPTDDTVVDISFYGEDEAVVRSMSVKRTTQSEKGLHFGLPWTEVPPEARFYQWEVRVSSTVLSHGRVELTAGPARELKRARRTASLGTQEKRAALRSKETATTTIPGVPLRRLATGQALTRLNELRDILNRTTGMVRKARRLASLRALPDARSAVASLKDGKRDEAHTHLAKATTALLSDSASLDKAVRAAFTTNLKVVDPRFKTSTAVHTTDPLATRHLANTTVHARTGAEALAVAEFRRLLTTWLPPEEGKKEKPIVGLGRVVAMAWQAVPEAVRSSKKAKHAKRRREEEKEEEEEEEKKKKEEEEEEEEDETGGRGKEEVEEPRASEPVLSHPPAKRPRLVPPAPKHGSGAGAQEEEQGDVVVEGGGVRPHLVPPAPGDGSDVGEREEEEEEEESDLAAGVVEAGRIQPSAQSLATVKAMVKQLKEEADSRSTQVKGKRYISDKELRHLAESEHDIAVALDQALWPLLDERAIKDPTLFLILFLLGRQQLKEEGSEGGERLSKLPEPSVQGDEVSHIPVTVTQLAAASTAFHGIPFSSRTSKPGHREATFSR